MNLTSPVSPKVCEGVILMHAVSRSIHAVQMAHLPVVRVAIDLPCLVDIASEDGGVRAPLARMSQHHLHLCCPTPHSCRVICVVQVRCVDAQPFDCKRTPENIGLLSDSREECVTDQLCTASEDSDQTISDLFWRCA